MQNDNDIFYTYESSQRNLSTKMQTRIFTKTLNLRNANTKHVNLHSYTSFSLINITEA